MLSRVLDLLEGANVNATSEAGAIVAVFSIAVTVRATG
jgi:hypothetical protein